MTSLQYIEWLTSLTCSEAPGFWIVEYLQLVYVEPAFLVQEVLCKFCELCG